MIRWLMRAYRRHQQDMRMRDHARAMYYLLLDLYANDTDQLPTYRTAYLRRLPCLIDRQPRIVDRKMGRHTR